MSLPPVLDEKLGAALADVRPVALTRRDAQLPAVAGKVRAVIGMRRAAETMFLHQLPDERRAILPAEQAV